MIFEFQSHSSSYDIAVDFNKRMFSTNRKLIDNLYKIESENLQNFIDYIREWVYKGGSLSKIELDKKIEDYWK